MDWDNVRVFLAVARAGQFAAGAVALQIDTTTASRRVAALENSLGTRLFDRTPTGCVITASGERLLRSAEATETELIQAERDLSRKGGDVSGTVRIAAPDGFATFFLCSSLAKLKNQLPSLNIQLVPMSRSFSLSRREADIAVTIERPSKGRVSFRRLVDYSLHFYAAKAYLKDRVRPSSVPDLAQHHLVTYVQDLLFADQLNFVPELFGPNHVRFECSTAIGQIAAVRAGAGIGILHDYAVFGETDIELVLPEQSFERSYWLVTHDDLVGLNRVQVVSDFIVSEINRRQAIFRAQAHATVPSEDAGVSDYRMGAVADL